MRATYIRCDYHAADTASFYFLPEKRLRYEAGQFVEVAIEHEADSRGSRRWFTLSSSPTESELAITTRIRKPGSSFKEALRTLRIGDSISISEAMGDFVLPKDESLPLVFIAAGIGITPFRSMIKHLIDNGKSRNIQMLALHNTADTMPFQQLIETYLKEALAVRHARTNAQEILSLYPPTDRTMYYVAGPEQFTEKIVRDLRQSGVASHQLVADYFHNYRA